MSDQFYERIVFRGNSSKIRSFKNTSEQVHYVFIVDW